MLTAEKYQYARRLQWRKDQYLSVISEIFIDETELTILTKEGTQAQERWQSERIPAQK